MKTIMSFEFEGTKPEVIAQVRELVTKLDPAAPIVEPPKIKASRPKRMLTEAERQTIRDRFAAGKAKAALARAQAVVPVPAVEIKGKPVGVKIASKALPMPGRGRKVKAKPSAQ